MGNGALGGGLLGGVIGAVLGAGAVLALRPPAPDPAPVTGADAAALREALAPLVEELREARGRTAAPEQRRARAAAPAAGDAVEAPDVAPPVLARAVLSDDVERDELRAEGVRWTPEPRLERLRDLRGFMDDASVRQRWLFTGQKEALAWFGTPTLVYTPGGSEEIWEYELADGVDEDGDELTTEFSLMFVHGRLAQVHGDGARLPDDD